MVKGVVRFKRVTEWWRPKAGVLVSLVLFFLAIHEVELIFGVKLLLNSIVTLTGFAVTGYILNDWADIDFDKQVGKPNSMEGLSVPARLVVLLTALSITALPWYFFFKIDSISLVLIGLQFSLLIAYPVPPIRLKRFPHIAVAVDAIYAFTIPAFLAWHTFTLTIDTVSTESSLALAALASWMVMKGVRQILNHHISDRDADARTGTPNVSLIYRPISVQRKIQNVVFPLELLGAMLFFGFVESKVDFLPWVAFAMVAIAGYKQLSAKRFWFNVSFRETYADGFSTFWLGLISTLSLMAFDIRYIWLALIFIILFSNIVYHPIVRVTGSSFTYWSKSITLFPFRVGSLIFNWSLYYFRKWALGWSEQRNWGEHYPKRLEDVKLAAAKKNGVVAIFNQNHDKFTETFVRGHLDGLPFHVVSFHGWPSPVHVNDMEHLFSKFWFLQKARYNWWNLSGRNVIEQENSIIEKRLLNEKVDVILAEFGMMGSRVSSVSKNTGIPLVVMFYGYDAWNKQVLAQTEYDEMFKQASKVIGVSQDICDQLIRLGCDSDKVFYLPCFVNLELFQPVDRQFEKLDILAVGRFSATKAPHLTILAFNEILKSVPDATLTMIGAEENDERLEMCLSLIQSLKIEDRISVKSKLNPESVRDHMHKASVFVQHSVTTPINGDKEGTPVAVMEAMATGLPVVSTRHAGIQEVIEDGVSGILVDEFDYLQMAKSVVDLFSDKGRISAISKEAANSIRANRLVVHHTQILGDILKASF